MLKGMHVVMQNPVGSEDKRIAEMKCGRIGVILEITDTGYARVAFYGDGKGVNYLIHPESLAVHSLIRQAVTADARNATPEQMAHGIEVYRSLRPFA